jgi:hypothetical protein
MNKMNEIFRIWAAGITALLMIGCGGESEIKTYRVAKEDSHTHAVSASATAAGAMSQQRPNIPHIHGDAAQGWEEMQPEKMRVASYRIAGDNGKSAELAVIPLPGVGKIELRSVNMWREELQLEPLTSEQLKEQTEAVQVGDAKGLMVDLTGQRFGQTNDSPLGILGAIAERGGITWFIKMAGDREVVSGQKNNFVSYLRSLEFHEGSHDTQPPAEVTQVAQAPSTQNPVSANTEKSPEAGKPNFKAPENWKTKAPGAMVQSAYNVEDGAGQAEVTISKFPGEVGGMVANIQRWKGQMGLPPGTAEEAQKSAEMIEVAGQKQSYMVDLKGKNVRSGKDARMVAIGVPYQGETWFFKLMGDEAVVAKEKDKFIQFVKSAY